MKVEATFDGYKLIPTTKEDRETILTLANELGQNEFMKAFKDAGALEVHKLTELVHSGKPYPDGVPDHAPGIVLIKQNHTFVIYTGDGKK